MYWISRRKLIRQCWGWTGKNFGRTSCRTWFANRINRSKKEVSQIINVVKVKKESRRIRWKSCTAFIAFGFYGNPRTGKTTVAFACKIYKSINVLSKGHLVEVDRSGLVGGYVGQTAIKTKESIEKAMGGILLLMKHIPWLMEKVKTTLVKKQ